MPKLIIRGLNFGETEERLSAWLSKWKLAPDRVIIPPKNGEESHRFAVVEADEAEAQKILATINGKTFGGNRLTVRRANIGQKPKRRRAERLKFAGQMNLGGS